MNKLHDNKGLTLIEIIISLAILGIIMIGFLNLFTFGYSNVMNAGHKSIAGFLAHQAADQKIAGGSPDPSVIQTTTLTAITVNLPSSSVTMTQSGQVISFQTERKGKKAKVTTFIP